MYTGPLVFTQIMDFMPLKTFQRCVARYQGNFSVKHFTCMDQLRTMAFAQLAYRESLRDIEVCLRAQNNKLYHMGIRSRVSRSTLAEANETRDWHIYSDFAHHLIGTARKLYCKESLAVDLDNTVYALDATTIDHVSLPLPLGILPGDQGGSSSSYPVGSARQYTKLYLHLRRNIPRSQHSGFNPSGSRCILHYGSRLHGFHQTARCCPGLFFFRDPSQVESQVPQTLFSSSGQIQGSCVRSIHFVNRPEVSRRLSGQTSSREILRHRNRQNSDVSDQQLSAARNHNRKTLQTTMAGRTLFQVDKAEPANQEFLRNFRERCQDPNLDCRFRLSDRRYHKKETESPRKSLHNFTGAERFFI